ncbi:MAG: hypothetical protein RJQ14_16760 [Marinoscillum sp.]
MKYRTALAENIDIYRAAKLLIDQHGQDADLFACQRADELLDTGDIDGQRVWLRIVKALQEMLNTTPDKLIH